MKKVLLYAVLSLVLFGLPLIAYTAEDYRGVKKCRMCHMKVYKSWETTAHATAFDALKPGQRVEAKQQAGLDPAVDYTTNAECVACHTTGADAALPGIQCEACHGPGAQYSKPTIMNKAKWKQDPETYRQMAIDAGLVLKPAPSNCVTCHNEKSPTFQPFDYAERIEQVKHKVD